MKTLALIAAVVLASCSSSADAYWFWPIPNPELAGWYSNYTTVYRGNVILAINQSNRGQAMNDLRQIMSTYGRTPRPIDPRTGFMAWSGFRPTQMGPGDEAEMLLEAIGGG